MATSLASSPALEGTGLLLVIARMRSARRNDWTVSDCCGAEAVQPTFRPRWLSHQQSAVFAEIPPLSQSGGLRPDLCNV